MIVKLINWLLRILSLTKNYNLAQEANKSVVYGAMLEITKNPKLWRHSDIGREYCYLTADGREVIVDLIQDILQTMDILDHKAMEQRAKELTFNILKEKS
jgi:hypothetical protein